MDENNQDDTRGHGGGEQHHEDAGALRKRTPVMNWLGSWLANGDSMWLRYGSAVLAVATALLIDKEDFLSGGFRVYLVFYPFIIMATLYGGLGPGLLAIALSCLSVTFFWAEPVGKFAIASRADRVSMVIFIVGNLFFVWICEWFRRAIRQAAQSEAFSVSLRDSLIEHLAVLDDQGVIIAVNRAWQQFAEKNGAPELVVHSVGINYLAICEKAPSYPHGEEAAAAKEGILAVLDGARKEFGLEYPCHSPEQQRWFQMHVCPLRGLKRGVVIAHLDITKRKQSEEALRQKEAFLRMICETTPDPIFAKDHESRFLMANPATLRVFGKPLEEVLGKRDDELYPDVETARGVLQNDRRVIESGIAEEFEETIETPSGRRIFLCTKAPYLGADGRIMGTIGVARDITERKQTEEAIRESEQRFRELVEQAPDAIVVHDVDLNRWVSANRSAEKLFGCSRQELLAGGPLRFYPSNQPDGFSPEESKHEHDRRALAGEQVVFQQVIHNAQGKDLTCEVRLVRQTSTKRRLLRASYIDITERKRAEEEVMLAKEVAEDANRAKDQFLAILSHELRTPLTPALMTVSTHEGDAALTPEFRDDLATVRRNLELEARLIDDLLDLNRLVRGKIELRRQARDLHRILENVLEICRAEVANKGLVVRWEPTATEHNVNGDDGRLQQVFWNLIKNATKFTSPGGTITLRSSNPHDGVVCVEVADTGIGINPQIIPRLFVAFEQGDLGPKAQFGGLGLGLAICKAVVDLHGGKIWAESEGPGKGATFAVEMPVTSSQVLTEDGVGPVVPTTSWTPASGGRTPRILLVEDNDDTLRILSRLLERAGCKVTPAQSMGAALAAARAAREGAERFDLVISDLGLPDGDGRELMRELHDRDGLSGIAISGFGMEEDIAKSRAAGFSKHLTKPIQIEELQAAISDLWAV